MPTNLAGHIRRGAQTDAELTFPPDHSVADQGRALMDATTTLSLVADVPGVRVAQLMRNLAHDLAWAGIEVRPPGAPIVPGQRGDVIPFGQLVLDLATSGAVTAPIECLRAYLARDRSLAFKVARPDEPKSVCFPSLA
jgi:hypothetical protein